MRHNKIKKISPTGLVFEGYIQDKDFILHGVTKNYNKDFFYRMIQIMTFSNDIGYGVHISFLYNFLF